MTIDNINLSSMPYSAHAHGYTNAEMLRGFPPIRNAWVVGSSPTGGSKIIKCLFSLSCVTAFATLLEVRLNKNSLETAQMFKQAKDKSFWFAYSLYLNISDL